MNNSQPSHVQAMEQVAALVKQAQAEPEQSDVATSHGLHAQQTVANLDRPMEHAAKSNKLPCKVQAMEQVADLVKQAQAKSEQSDITTGPCK